MEDEFFMVFGNDGSPYYDDDGNVLIQRHADGTQFYVSPQCISTQDCPTQASNHVPSAVNENMLNEQEESPTGETRQWTRDEIISLIHHYKINKRRFASTTIKNVKVWQDIARALGSHTAKQCENKFKYLRTKYFQKKDNMSHKSSGARHIHFDYFSEMDEIYCKEPIVKPVAIASSSREYPVGTLTETADSNPQTETADSNPQTETTNSNPQRDSNDHETTENNYNPAPRSRRSIKLKEALNDLNNILKDAEADKRKRHSELMQLQKYNIEKFSELMGKILEKM